MMMRPGGRPADDAAAARYRSAGWWDGRRLLDRFESHVARSPEALALVSGEVTLSRAELWNAAGEAAEKIRSITGPGRRVVVLLLPNETAWLVMFLAVLRAGQVPATPPVTTTANHLRHIFELTEPALAISVGRHRQAAPADTVRQAAAGVAGVVVGLAEGRSLDVCGARGVPATGAPESGVDVPEATAHLMFTSGTTGLPKVVSHSEDSLATLNRQFAERFSLGPDTPLFMPSPLGHSVGAIHGARLSMFLGAPLVVQDQWHAATALDLVSRHRAAFTAAATPFLFDLANAPWRGREPKLAPLKSFLCGGAQVPPALIRLIGDGFFRTGDLARIDADGYVSITGRVKDLIIRGGVNISPVETENAIAAHPDVVGVAVIGWPDERLGERLCAAVQTTAPITLADVLTFCAAEGLPRHFWPERLESVEHFPRTAAGKIKKHELQSRLLDRATAAGANDPGGAEAHPGEDR